MSDDKIRVMMKCKHCDYSWLCKSDKQWVSCPNCLKKMKTFETDDNDDK